ncbi:MAG: hypothetical protein Q4D29_11395 [Lachnospiraceae bacterium]|nr:hypothetical protein [Lachnospiraceae bacterium]
MFTTKHHSFAGVMGVMMCLISIIVMAGGIYMSFVHSGKSNVIMGAEGLFAMILDFLGIIAGLTSLSERDIHRWVPIVSIVANSIVLALWIALVMLGKTV